MIKRLSPVIWLFAALSSIQAAPPTVNYFFPAGGQRGTSVSVTVDGAFGHWPPKVWVDHEGIAVEPAKETGKLLVTIAQAAVPGVYAIRLYDEEGASSARPFLVGTLPEIMEREPNDDFKKPQVLDKTRVIVNGRLGKVGDVDTFALALKKGQTLVASLEANRTLRSPLDGHLQVLAPDGFVLEHNDDFHGIDPQIVFPVPRDGTYLMRTFAFPAVPDASIRLAGGDKFVYRLTLTTGAFLDYPYPLAVPRSLPGDVELIGWNLPAALHRLRVPFPGEADQVTLFHPEIANIMVVRLEPHAAVVKAVSNSRAQPQTIDLPVTVTGRIERPGEVDYYQFHGAKGQKLVFRAEAQTLGFPLSPILNVSAHDGKLLAKTQASAPGQDPVLDFTVPLDGTFTLTVRDLYGTGSGRHVYRLQCLPAKPDFALKLATDRFVVAPGKPLDVTVAIERAYGFNNEIELDVEGLPEGVSVATLPGDSKKAKSLTLRLSADRAPYSGPVRVVGIDKGASGTTRVARTGVADLGTVTEDLWLTVGK